MLSLVYRLQHLSRQKIRIAHPYARGDETFHFFHGQFHSHYGESSFSQGRYSVGPNNTLILYTYRENVGAVTASNSSTVMINSCVMCSPPMRC